MKVSLVFNPFSYKLHEENLRIVENMYNVGSLANMDFIDAQLARNSARANRINAVYDHYIAEATLERALGNEE